MPSTTKPAAWKMMVAFAVIYLVWGSTFLAIRVGVQEVPPYLFGAMRFFTAGVLLFTWMVVRKEELPTLRQWGFAGAIAIFAFLLNYGPLFWAEQRVPSGVAAVMMATIPLFTALMEILILRTGRLTARLMAALLIGLAGVGVLMSHSLGLGVAPIDKVRAGVLLFASISWSTGSVLTRKLSGSLPSSKGMGSAAQMMMGGAFLAGASWGMGEFGRFHPAAVSRSAWVALVYLIIAGSIVGFTTYLWLIHHESPTKVATYAYVNPVVAVILGYLFAGEGLGVRTVVGAACVLLSVVVITTAKRETAQVIVDEHEMASRSSGCGDRRGDVE